MLDISSAEFREKVYGCWMGKNCGGTLGGPLEEAWGQPEPLDVWWYPKLQEGGIPNDDLEMQLIWLKALEEVGPGLKAADLAQYWLDHIGYNWDEYGLSKTNLRLGLLPPVSGAYNNWFKDCMGCPIRSEIWACVAPGLPNIACRYAYEDAICDHAGGESVYGEMFNTAIESAAFVVSDRETLLDIGRSYVPDDSETAKAVDAARAAYRDGVDWKEARRRVLAATPHHVAQYSPINMAFQVIGWLWGADFGEAICIAVNCGYDTDCTGATLGSILGILAGKQGLPAKWTEPLGESIATNEPWGRLRHASDGANPVPTDLTELTERVIAQARRVLTENGYPGGVVPAPADVRDLYADEKTRALWSANPMRVDSQTGALSVGVDYGDTPAVRPGEAKTLRTHLTNPHPEALRVRCGLHVPAGWPSVEAREVEVPANGSVAVEWSIPVPGPAHVANANSILLAAHVEGRPLETAAPIVLIGVHRYRCAGPFTAQGFSDRELFDHALAPEEAAEVASSEGRRPGEWREAYSLDNVVPVGDTLAEGGAIYAQTFLWSPEASEVRLKLATTCPMKLWLNGEPTLASFRYRPVRPNYTGDSEEMIAVRLQAGWNEVLLKLVRAPEAAPVECHLLLSTPDRLSNGLPEIGRTRFPWDE